MSRTQRFAVALLVCSVFVLSFAVPQFSPTKSTPTVRASARP